MLTERFATRHVILENAEDPDLRRGPRVQKLLRRMAEVCVEEGFRVSQVAKSQVSYAFRGRDVRNKSDRALLIAQLFPQLGSRVPPPREVWMAESSSMGVFDAVALALAELGVPQEPSEDASVRYRRLAS